MGKCVERGRCESLCVWRLSKSHTIRRPAGCYAHMPADSLDGRQATFSGPGVRGCRFRVLRWDPCPGGKVNPRDSDDDIPQLNNHRGARTVLLLVQACQFWQTSDHDSRSGGPCPRSAYSHCSSSDVIRFAVHRVQVAECRPGRACTSRTNAPPFCWARGGGCQPAWCAGNWRRGLKYSPLVPHSRSEQY